MKCEEEILLLLPLLSHILLRHPAIHPRGHVSLSLSTQAERNYDDVGCCFTSIQTRGDRRRLELPHSEIEALHVARCVIGVSEGHPFIVTSLRLMKLSKYILNYGGIKFQAKMWPIFLFYAPSQN